jgi:hypothetical protein
LTVNLVSVDQIHKASLEESNPFATEEAWVDNVAQAQAAGGSEEGITSVSEDPTLVNAGLTELDTGVSTLNGKTQNGQTPSAPASADVGAGNTAADEQWDRTVSASEDPLAESFEMVPRDPAETETPSVPAPTTSTQSWAEDTPVEAPVTPAEARGAPVNGSDGFHEVHHGRGGRGRGSFGDRGGHRRGPRGDGRGRGGFHRPRGDRGGRGGGYRGRANQ